MKTVEGFRAEDTDDAAGSVKGSVLALPPLLLHDFFFVSLAWIHLTEIIHTSSCWTKSKNNN
jgi:hypothetical protein